MVWTPLLPVPGSYFLFLAAGSAARDVPRWKRKRPLTLVCDFSSSPQRLIYCVWPRCLSFSRCRFWFLASFKRGSTFTFHLPLQSQLLSKMPAFFSCHPTESTSTGTSFFFSLFWIPQYHLPDFLARSSAPFLHLEVSQRHPLGTDSRISGRSQ